MRAMADRDAEIESQLALFDRDPSSFMNQRPAKRDARTGQCLDHAPTAFSASDIANNRFVEERDKTRKKMSTEHDGELISLDQILPGRAPFKSNDLAENLVDKLPTPLLRRLEEMEAARLTSAQLPESPWSDNYWPIYQGILGARYADEEGPDAQDWQERRRYTESRPLLDIVHNAVQAEIDNLSPSEKYDLLLGHVQAPLTEAMWNQGRTYFERSGTVELWMGICHGWAPASFMLPRPRRVVELPSADPRFKIRFFPSDIKALGSLLWASTNPPTRFIGGRCNDKQPKLDENGRVISDAGFDTNPGTWHLTVVNQIGVAKRSLIIDATFDYEVWNQPVFGYSYSYFNPVTRKVTKKLSEAVVSRADYAKDPFTRYRSPGCVSMVGVSMDLVYIAETAPTHDEADSPERDRRVSVTYLYDVELDAAGRIIGGEWYTNKHPDFLWTPPPGISAATLGDKSAVGSWNPQYGVPQTWRDAGLGVSQGGQPLARIVTALFDLAK
jgi:hypothetical protein